MKHLIFGLAILGACSLSGESIVPPAIRNIRAEHHNGQTFITWLDAAEGEANADLRYDLYHSDKPITALPEGKPRIRNLPYNSGKLFGFDFQRADRLNPEKPWSKIREDGAPLAPGSGLAVVTVDKPGNSFYAVVATANGIVMTTIVPGQNATTEAISEQPGEIVPIKQIDSKDRGRSSASTSITGTQGLPLHVELHASNATGGIPGEWGDYYLYFAKREWGYREGLPGIFCVRENRNKSGNSFNLRARDTLLSPLTAHSGFETYWFGYLCTPDWATEQTPYAWNFTEERMLWVIEWVINHYGADRNRISCGGGSMGAWGSTTFALRHPEIFAAIYPNRPRTRQRGLPSYPGMPKIAADKVLMSDGKTPYLERMDMVRFVENHPGDLPFVGWCCGRRDGFATWKEQIEMVNAMTRAKHGFAFAWNNGNHSSGVSPMETIQRYYSSGKFAKNLSYPAFGNSSINDNLGNGDPADGDLGNDDKKSGPLEVFGINLGFIWADVRDEAGVWSVTVENDRCKEEMTVDVTPRRCQAFKPQAGAKCRWRSSLGTEGEVTADANGLVTVEKLAIKEGVKTTLEITLL